MTKIGLLVRSLCFHWPANVAVLAGCAVGAAVLTGALLVGDSMRGSLRDLTIKRLGAIDEVVVGPHFFGDSLAARMQESQPGSVANVILVGGSVTSPDGKTAPQTNLVGVTAEFWKFFGHSDEQAQRLASQTVANAGLARELELKAGDRLRVSLQREADIPREGLLGERDSEKVLRQIAFEVDGFVEDDEGGRFSLQTTQNVPSNLYVPIQRLADALEQPGRGNALLVSAGAGLASPPADLVADAASIKDAMTLDDYGVEIHAQPDFDYVRIESRKKILDARLLEKVRSAAQAAGGTPQSVLAYLANAIAVGEKEAPYSIVAAVEPVGPPPLGALPADLDREPKPDEILLNQWTVDQLEAAVGDTVTLTYFLVDDSGEAREESTTFTLAGVVAMQDVALDRHFTPEYHGITDADTFSDWDPPFPFEPGRVRPPDEKYWDDYRTAPKGFVSLAAGQQLWSTRHGNVTSVRALLPEGTDAQAFVDKLETQLLDALAPADVDMVPQAVKRQSLQASEGSSDFGQLFFGFSFFLIASAGLLVGLLFRLNTERRASQIGLMLAVGLPVRQVRALLTVEGMILAAAGSAVGLLGAFGYAQQMILLLNTSWQAAVSTPFLEFHWTLGSLIVGYVLSLVVAAAAIWWGVGRLGRVAVPSLLHRGFTFASSGGQGGRWSGVVAAVGIAGGAAATAFAAAMGENAVGIFFAAGALLLVGFLGLLSYSLRSQTGSLTAVGKLGLTRLGVRNGGRYPARSVLTAGLLAFATFVVVAVGMMRHGEQQLMPDKDSGNGGFSLIAQSAVPIHQFLTGEDAAFELNLSQEAEDALQQAEVQHLRLRPGDDLSCLNVYQPEKPTLLGVHQRFIERGGFAFANLLDPTDKERENPWALLNRDLGDDVIPAIGDANTMQWILKKGLGQEIEMIADNGRPVRIRLVGALSGSVFQSELLVSEENLLRHFSSVSGYRYFLFETPADDAQPLGTMLQTDLADYGLAAQTTWDRIAAYKAVENTYMGSFQTLGGLGLVLGTLGLGTVLFRNVLERRGELGLMRALGFKKASLAWLVLTETLFLLVAGVAVGTACALIAVAPQAARIREWGPILSLGETLALVLIVGALSGLVAVATALRTPLLTALRSE